MTGSPVIAFGQQPCGFFPKRFLVAKVRTARRLQAELGGEIVFFYHDSDHDPRETQTLLRHRATGEPAKLNFAFENKLQRKFSPLYLKRIQAGWHDKTLRQLPNYVGSELIDVFRQTTAPLVADFCLALYERLGLLTGVRVLRSSDPALRRSACAIDDFYVDLPHGGEIVRARCSGGQLRLHEGGDAYVALPPTTFTQAQVSPTRDTRLRWMQSVLHCTHYVTGAGEQHYLHHAEAPEVIFVTREPIDRSDEAYLEFNA